MQSKDEPTVEESLSNEGWTAINTNRGFPDLFCVRLPKQGQLEIKFVEVKSRSDEMSRHQLAVANKLKAFGLDFEIRFVSHSKHPVEKAKLKRLLKALELIEKNPEATETEIVTKIEIETGVRKTRAYGYLALLKQAGVIREKWIPLKQRTGFVLTGISLV